MARFAFPVRDTQEKLDEVRALLAEYRRREPHNELLDRICVDIETILNH